MNQLLLLRHAKSSWDDPHLADHARPLNARGRQAAGAMRNAMRELGMRPQLVFVSSARRTLQTLEALKPWEAEPVVAPMDALYLASAEQILNTVAGVPDHVGCVLLLGHNPGLHDAALRLAGRQSGHDAERLELGFPTAALAEFRVERWGSLGGGERGADHRLVRFLMPADLPELAS